MPLCYDLLATRLLLSAKEDPEEFALPLAGKKHKLKYRDFKSFSETLLIPNIVFEKVLAKFLKSRNLMHVHIAKSFLPEGMKKEYIGLIDERFDRLSW